MKLLIYSVFGGVLVIVLMLAFVFGIAFI